MKKLNCLGNRKRQVKKKWHGNGNVWQRKKTIRAYTLTLTKLSEIGRPNRALAKSAMSLKVANHLHWLQRSVCLCIYIFSQFHFLFTFIHFIDRKIQINEQKIKSIAEHKYTWLNKAYGAIQSPLKFFSRKCIRTHTIMPTKRSRESHAMIVIIQ